MTLSLEPSFHPSDTLSFVRTQVLESVEAAGMRGVVVPRDDAAREPGAGVARLEAFRVATAAQVVDSLVHDDGAAHDGVLGALLQRDEAVVDEHVGGVAVAVRQDVAEVADVALRRVGVAVVLLHEVNRPSFVTLRGNISSIFAIFSPVLLPKKD